MSVGLLAGGSGEKFLKDLFNHRHWVGVDRGALRLIEAGVTPDLAVGDFDSVGANELKKIKHYSKEVIVLPTEKDDTDTEAALEKIIEFYPKEKITLYGSTGGRMDHFLQNFYMILQPRFEPLTERFQMKDEQNTIRFLKPGTHQIVKEKTASYFSIFCLTPVQQLTIQQAKYNVQNLEVSQSSGFISNEFVGRTASVSFQSGTIALIQSND